MELARGGKREGAGRPAGDGSTVVRLRLPVARFARRLDAGTVRWGEISAFIDVEPRTALSVPLVASRVACGFPSPADDYMEGALDFNELLIENPPATFTVRIAGESMTGAGIYPRDLAIVDRSQTPAHGRIVLVLIDGEFTIKRYCLVNNRVVLRAENPAYSNIEISEESTVEIWGVIKRSIRMHEE